MPYEHASYVASIRQVPAGSGEDRLRDAMQELLKGVTPSERDQGLSSIFSSETASMLNEVSLQEGMARIDFKDLRKVIPQGATSHGGAVLLQQLNHTVFGLDPVDEVEYQMQGSCASFWEWQETVCFILTRSDWESGKNPLADE